MRKIHHSKLAVSHEEHVLTLVGDLSDLRIPGFPCDRDRVWPDACDVGLAVQGHAHEVQYVLAEEQKDPEGELIAFVLTPTDESMRRVPACAKTRLVIYND